MAFPRSGTVDTQTYSGTKDFFLATLSATQSANVGANDHLKFDTIQMQRGGASSGAGAASGGSVLLDTATTYSNSDGAASLGRFSLQGGKVYKLTLDPGYFLFSGATGVITLSWADVTGTAATIGNPLNIYTQADASQDGVAGSLTAMFAPGGSSGNLFLVEARITAVTALTSIGNTAKGLPIALVETY